MKLYSPKTIGELKRLFNFEFSKGLGQNFLTDKNIIDKIVSSTEATREDLIIEIGPGIGVLTYEAAQCAKKLIAIEIDRRLLPILYYTLSEFDNVEVINEDVLKVDINEIIKESKCKGVKIIGNLPYYITTPIIMYLLESHVKADSITVMMQKEVADRIKALPGSKNYGAITVAVNYYCDVEIVANVSKESFVPAPKVDSTVLKFIIKKKKDVEVINESLMFRCIKAGFGQRRKTLLNSLSTMGIASKNDLEKMFINIGIDGKRRAETLSLEEFALIANALSHQMR